MKLSIIDNLSIRKSGGVTIKNSMAERLKQIVSRPEEEIDLAEAALLIAQEEYPHLDIGAYLRLLDDLSGKVRARLSPGASPEKIIATMNYFLFKEKGFAGNEEQYYDPRNSFLNEVLDRRLGIPITLSIVYMEVGRRLGLPLEGVSFPGHFLVKLELEQSVVILDPFSGGIALSEQDLTNRLHQFLGDQLDVPLDRWFASTGKKDILARMLLNLKVVYSHREEFSKVLSVIDRILLICPDQPEQVRDRGLLYERLECAQSALQDYQRYIELEPDATDAGEIRSRMITLRRTTPALH